MYGVFDTMVINQLKDGENIDTKTCRDLDEKGEVAR